MIKGMGFSVRPGTILKAITVSSILAPLLMLHHLQISFPSKGHLDLPEEFQEEGEGDRLRRTFLEF